MQRLCGCSDPLTQWQLCAEFVAKFLVAELWFHLANCAGNRALIFLKLTKKFCFRLRPGRKTFSADRLTVPCASGQRLQICNEFIASDLSKT